MLLLTEIKISISAIMKNHKIGSATVPGGPKRQLLTPPPNKKKSLGQEFDRCSTFSALY